MIEVIHWNNAVEQWAVAKRRCVVLHAVYRCSLAVNKYVLKFSAAVRSCLKLSGCRRHPGTGRRMPKALSESWCGEG